VRQADQIIIPQEKLNFIENGENERKFRISASNADLEKKRISCGSSIYRSAVHLSANWSIREDRRRQWKRAMTRNQGKMPKSLQRKVEYESP
jgi:hypothetical protein